MITLALSKGRIFEETLPLLRVAGIDDQIAWLRLLLMPLAHSNRCGAKSIGGVDAVCRAVFANLNQNQIIAILIP